MAYSKIRPRRGTRYEWQTINPILAEGELVVEVPDDGVGTGLSKFKIGDGINHYNDLPYAFDGASASAIYGGDATNFSTIQLRAAEHNVWLGVDPVLAKNEITYDITVKGIKIGNGVDNWSQLPYFETFGSYTNYNGTGRPISDYGDEDSQSTSEIIEDILNPSDEYQSGTGKNEYVDDITDTTRPSDDNSSTDNTSGDESGDSNNPVPTGLGGIDFIDEDEPTVGLNSLL